MEDEGRRCPRANAGGRDDSGTWDAAGEPVDDLTGAFDIDLTWTPATNMIPIRRLGLEVGEQAESQVAVVPFPERQVALRTQKYERTAERRYRYTSGDYSVDLTVNEQGFVSVYPGLWTVIAEA